MKRWIKLLTAIAAVALIALTAAAVATGGEARAGAKVEIGKKPLGRILVDSKGITLYDFPLDTDAAIPSGLWWETRSTSGEWRRSSRIGSCGSRPR
jgi:predicted lipoprotein with Yx(FWY)xxD motif